MSVPPIDLTLQHKPILNDLLAGITEVVHSNAFINGPYVQAFEQDLAKYLNVKHVVGVSSGTDALLLALMAKGIGDGDQVITSPFTFFATGGAIARTGATPVFVDIDPATFNLNANLVASCITAQTKAIIPVHLYGQMTPMDDLLTLAKQHNLTLIEDAAQAIGAHCPQGQSGAVGHLGCISFYPTKNLSCFGDGGAIALNDETLANKLRIMRDHGQDPTYYYNLVGGNFRLDALQAKVLQIKLPHLNNWICARRQHAHRYNQRLADLPLVLPIEAKGMFHAYNQYTVRVPENKRDALRDHLRQHQIACNIYYPLPLHLQACFKSLGYQPGDLPQSEKAANQVLSLPNYPEMTASQQDEVVDAIESFYG